MPKATSKPEEQFTATVAEALKHYHDPLWLGQYSPLATPYFLGALLQHEQQSESTAGRGQGLQRAIEQAVASLWPGALPQSRKGLLKLVEEERTVELYGPRYLFLLLDLRYLRRYFLPSSAPNTVGAMYDMLNVSATRFFVHLQMARGKLAEALLRVSRPSLRLECPLPPVLIGRDKIMAQCWTDLQDGHSTTLSGQAGIGKTSLGAHLAQHWPSGAAFWYTFRPGLNDDLAGVVFALAHFLQQQDCSSMWLQLMANETILDNLEQLVGFLREDLACAGRLPILLCFDEVDLLHTDSTQPRHGVHKQILELLESLRSLAPLLLIGQRGLIDSDVHHELESLTPEDTAILLRRAGVQAPDSIEKIQLITGGNPRFLELYISLLQSTGADEDLDLGRAPSIKPLFNRLWKRLDDDEKRLLTTLSIFRSMAPRDAWQGQEGLDNLQHRKLLKFDARGGVALLPLFRELVFEELSPQQRLVLHQEGALLRAQRGQYTEAAHHLWQAEQFESAVDLWYEKQAVEIEQGKAGAAYALFKDAKPPGLTKPGAKRLKVIQDHLSLLHGDAAAVLEDIDSYSWHLNEKITAEAMEQWGRAKLIRGDIDGALDEYDDAISVLGELSTQIVLLRRQRGQMHIMQADMDLAERETRLAQFEIEWLQALVESAQGKFPLAQEHLRAARQIAVAASDDKRVAKSDQFLAMAAGNHGDFERARRHAQDAMTYFERSGDRLSLEDMRAEVAGFYLNERRFDEAIEPSLATLRFFENISHHPRIAYISSNLAEAYYETGQLELAEKYALRAIQSEDRRLQPYACYTLGQVRYAQNRLADAEHVFQTGIDAAKQSRDDFIAAYLYRVYGKVLCQEKRLIDGLANLRTALDYFNHLKMPSESEQTALIIQSYSQL